MNTNFITDRALSITEDDRRLRLHSGRKEMGPERAAARFLEDNSIKRYPKDTWESLRMKSTYYRVVNQQARIRDRQNQKRRREAMTLEEKKKEQERSKQRRQTTEHKDLQKKVQQARQQGHVRPGGLTDEEMHEIGSFVQEKGVNAAARHFKIDTGKATQVARFMGYEVPEKDGLTENDRSSCRGNKTCHPTWICCLKLGCRHVHEPVASLCCCFEKDCHEEGIDLMDALYATLLKKN